MSTYKLTYFNFTGMAEPIRFILSYAGVEFEDCRVSSEDWPKYKPQMPMGQVPILEIDGKIYHQSQAICRYLAKTFNLYGSNDLEALKIDASLADIEDMRIAVCKYYHENDTGYKAKLKTVAEEKTSFAFKKLEERVTQNGGYFVNAKLSYVDIYFTAAIGYLCHFMERDLLNDRPGLKKLHDTVLALPKIKAYIDKRPKTIF